MTQVPQFLITKWGALSEISFGPAGQMVPMVALANPSEETWEMLIAYGKQHADAGLLFFHTSRDRIALPIASVWEARQLMEQIERTCRHQPGTDNM